MIFLVNNEYEPLAEIEQAKLDVFRKFEQVKSNKDAVQERFDKLSNKLSDLKLSRTELTSLQRFKGKMT